MKNSEIEILKLLFEK